MKVKDIMNSDVEVVTTDTPVIQVSRLIFGRGISGVPVVTKEDKLAGFITEKDIVSRFYPSVQEFIEDPVNTKDFEVMEKNVYEVFNLTAENIMSHNLITVHPETPVLHAHSLMIINKIGRLPVVNESGKLVGIVSKGDIFRSVVKGKIPYTEDEEYHDWISKQYDTVIGWGERLPNEIPDLVDLFKEQKVKKILDVGCGTGEHDVELARRGFKVTGLETSTQMFSKAQEKRNKLPKGVKDNLEFIKGDYLQLFEELKNDYDAAIFMGNALPHQSNWKEILKGLNKKLNRHAVLAAQITNLEKIFRKGKRFQDFNIRKLKNKEGKEIAFLEFFDPPKRQEGAATFNMVILGSDGNKWSPKALNSTSVQLVDDKNIEPVLRQLGFKDISFYGSRYWGPIFKDKFDILESDRLNVVAVR